MSFDPGWSFDNSTWAPQPSGTGVRQRNQIAPYLLQSAHSQLFLTTPPTHTGHHHPIHETPYPDQTQHPRPFLARPPPQYQTGDSHLVQPGPLDPFQTFPPQYVLSEAPHLFQAAPPHLLQPQFLRPLQTQPPLYQSVTQNVFLKGPSPPFRPGTQRNSVVFIHSPRQRVISEITPLTTPSTSSSELRIMDSGESSPEKQNNQQTHAELLQAFQSFKPARGGGPSKTPQPPSTSRAQRSSTPAPNAGQATRAGMTAFEQSPSTAPSTQETTTTRTRKRTRRTPYTEQIEENVSSESETSLSQVSKRPRQTPAKTSQKQVDASTTKQASISPMHRVEVQIHNGLASVKQAKDRSRQHIESRTQEEHARASMTPDIAASSIDGTQYQNSANIFAPQSAQSGNAFATQLLNENQTFAQFLTQKNGIFLRSVPLAASSHLEAKLAKVTDEMTRLHKEKVDAIRLEYVAELQRDMNERQKVIDMLLQKADG